MSKLNLGYVNVAEIKASYAPYNRFDRFEQGYADALAGNRGKEFNGVDGQAYDRGLEAGSKVLRAAQWISQNVGAN
jgi:hypothetical protein